MLVTLDRGFVFAADLIRRINAPVVCHFVRADVRDVHQGGYARREVVFGSHPELKGRDVLVVDAVLESGVTQEFLLRRNQVWIGYGLAAPNGTGRNLRQLSSGTNNAPRKSGKGRKKEAR